MNESHENWLLSHLRAQLRNPEMSMTELLASVCSLAHMPREEAMATGLRLLKRDADDARHAMHEVLAEVIGEQCGGKAQA